LTDEEYEKFEIGIKNKVELGQFTTCIQYLGLKIKIEL